MPDIYFAIFSIGHTTYVLWCGILIIAGRALLGFRWPLRGYPTIELAFCTISTRRVGAWLARLRMKDQPVFTELWNSKNEPRNH